MKLIHILISISLVFISTTSSAQVYFNGQLYQGVELYLLQQIYGGPIHPGNYWLMQNGNWGFADSNQVQGNLFTDNRPNGVINNPNGGKRYFEDEVDDFCARNGGC